MLLIKLKKHQDPPYACMFVLVSQLKGNPPGANFSATAIWWWMYCMWWLNPCLPTRCTHPFSGSKMERTLFFELPSCLADLFLSMIEISFLFVTRNWVRAATHIRLRPETDAVFETCSVSEYSMKYKVKKICHNIGILIENFLSV